MVKNACVTGEQTTELRPKKTPTADHRKKLQPIEIVFILAMLAIPVLHFCVFWSMMIDRNYRKGRFIYEYL